ncbi:uncharacterized protein LOC115622988 [Scaptodrosophila lebanonensis]|uniref:Uncharacterized protein LOC115622988 n=1 Tax=Drosophila lebanonensis TaxID=7225 RepID=A0A6J2TAE9_DROLE|nr:uncharacterized protein LOC115622988 [Scaptodrosophila lebanonensis]
MRFLTVCGAYLALAFEAVNAFRTTHEIINLTRGKKYAEIDIMAVGSEMLKVFCFSLLIVGIIMRTKFLLKAWLLLSYTHINWGVLLKVIFSIYEYVHGVKRKSVKEFLKQFLMEHGEALVHILVQAAIISIVYVYYESIDPKKCRKLKKIQASNEMNPSKENSITLKANEVKASAPEADEKKPAELQNNDGSKGDESKDK